MRIRSYDLIQLVGKGSFGCVYRARQTPLDRIVAVKQSLYRDGAEADLFLKEAQIMSQLRHYSVSGLLDYFIEGDVPYMVMTWADGHPLSRLVQIEESTGKARKPLDPEHTLWVMDRILEGVEYLHRMGITHNDIKPDNIMVEVDRHACVLIDFTVAVMGARRDTVGKGGTPGYLAPEILSRLPPLFESDLWSVAKVWIAMLGGDPILGVPPDGVDKSIRDLLDRMLQPDPRNRPGQAGQIRQEIRKIRASLYGRSSTNEIIKWQDGSLRPHRSP